MHTIRAGGRRRARRGRQAAAAFEGEHDFAQFANLPERDADPVRRVARCALVAGPGPALRIEVAGDGFLWRMVRHMVRARAASKLEPPYPY
jgi:tRNA pseudouridine38-40 synthase